MCNNEPEKRSSPKSVVYVLRTDSEYRSNGARVEVKIASPIERKPYSLYALAMRALRVGEFVLQEVTE